MWPTKSPEIATGLGWKWMEHESSETARHRVGRGVAWCHVECPVHASRTYAVHAQQREPVDRGAAVQRLSDEVFFYARSATTRKSCPGRQAGATSHSIAVRSRCVKGVANTARGCAVRRASVRVVRS
jgi:hypothetical protein